MPTFLGNLPVHPLVVHAVVVLVPLAVLGGLAVVVWPAARRRYGWLIVAVAAVATAAIPIATSSGEGLEHRLPRAAAIETHARLGDDLLVYVACLLVALAAFVYLHHRGARTRRDGPGTTTAPTVLTGRSRVAAAVLAVLVVVLAVISTVQVYRIGDSGAQAAWGDRQYLAPSTPTSGTNG